MRLRKWVLTDRQKRVLLYILGTVAVFIAIGLVPPTFFIFLLGGIAYGLFVLTMRIRRNRRGDTRTY